MLAAMIFRFGPFEFDAGAVELRADGKVRPVEPQVFALLALLIENRDRLVSTGELIEKVWDGRVVSDAAVSSRIKSARHALGDDGKTQRYIRTLHRQGFRFVGDVRVQRPSAPEPAAVEQSSRPSIAVLPFQLIGADGPYAAIADALPHELIAELSRLRWLFVIARGSSFRLRDAHADLGEVGRLLGVRYCLTGSVEIQNARLAVTVQLVDTRNDRVVWAERFAGALADVHAFRTEIVARVRGMLEIRIPAHEADQARLGSSADLDAWASYHLGLQHMYRFNRSDNALAAAHFQQAIAQDPAFARAHAGLSFVHFQTAFMRHTNDLPREIELARQFALRAQELDPLDPFVNFALGRTYWLQGDLDSGLAWLERSILISPNYAQGIYALAWTETLSGRTPEGRAHVDLAMRLSPLDPLHYAMLGTRALAHMIEDEPADAAHWGEMAARSPGAHVLIAMIAAVAHALAGDDARARTWAASVRARNPALTRDDFFRAFPMRAEAARARITGVLSRLGL
jgi:TolB-like protein